jgi:hypothetical protein
VELLFDRISPKNCQESKVDFACRTWIHKHAE